MKPQARQPGVAKREVFGWAMYDFANSGFTTVVITAVFFSLFCWCRRARCAMGRLCMDSYFGGVLCAGHVDHARARRLG